MGLIMGLWWDYNVNNRIKNGIILWDCGNKDWDDGMGLIVQLNDYWEFVIPIMQVSVIKLPTSKLT